MTKAIAYGRISPRPDVESSESIEFQLEECRKYAAKQGMEIVGEYSDHAMSGGDADRPGVLAAFAALKRGYVLLVYKLDRLARDLLQAEIWRKKIEDDGASIYAVTGGGNELTPTGIFLRQVLGAMAEFQRNMTRQHTSVAMLRHQRSGRRMSAIPPYGWARDPDNEARLVQNMGEQIVIERIMELHREGLGLRAITRKLQEEKLDCRGRPTFYHAQIGRVIGRAESR